MMTAKIKKWLNYSFESSSVLTTEFSKFNRDIKSFVKNETKDTFELVSWSRGHFGFSGFLRNLESNKFVYFSASDVRHFPDSWFSTLLVRTAEHAKDYTGGMNNTICIENITEKALGLSK